ncbi:MAG: YceI family protein [Gammaproteobacteria bacterium]
MRVSPLSLALLVTFSLSTQAQAELWAPVAADSTLSFTGEQQSAPFEGLFNKFSATFDLDPADPTTARIEAIIDMDSVDTLYDERDEALREAEWFDVERFPEGRFVSQRIQQADSGYMADAFLTLRDTTQPIALQFTLQALPDGRLRFEGQTVVSRLAFGVGSGQWTNTDWVGDAVTIKVSLVLEQTLP